MLITPKEECRNCRYLQEINAEIDYYNAEIDYYKDRYEELQQLAVEYKEEICSRQDVPDSEDEQD